MGQLLDARFVLWAVLLVFASAKSTPKYDVIIVGAGLSGLTAATILKDDGYDVLVLEASKRVGGRMYTVHNSKTGHVDLGGTFIDSEHSNMWEQLKKYKFTTYSSNSKGDALCRRGGKVLRYTVDPPFPTESDTEEYEFLVKKMENDTKKAERDETFAEQLDKITFQNWLNQTIRSKLVKENIKMLSRTDFCADPSEVSSLYALQDFDSAGGLEDMNTYNQKDEYLCNGGVQQLPIAMARQLGRKVLLNKAVQRIQSTVTQVTVTTADNKIYQASFVIMAVPPSAQQDIRLSPRPSAARRAVIKNMPMGSVIKTFVFYKEAHWKTLGLSGYSMCEADNCTICTSLDYTKPDGSFPSLVGFISGKIAQQLSSLTQDQRKARVIEQYAQMFNISEMRNPTHYLEYNWNEDPYVHGGYSAIRKPGILEEVSNLSINEGLIYYAGTEMAKINDGYMDGAIDAGERAAKMVAEAIKE